MKENDTTYQNLQDVAKVGSECVAINANIRKEKVSNH